MQEIYSEIVRDLLNKHSSKKQGLLVRQDPKIGFYSNNNLFSLLFETS